MSSRFYHYIFNFITVLAAILSLVSLFPRVVDFPTSELIESALDYYQLLSSFLISPINYVLPFDIPLWYQNTWLGSLFLLAIFVRSYRSTGGQLSRRDILPLTAGSFVYLGFLVAFTSLARFIYFAAIRNTDGLADEREFISIVLTTAGAVVAVFAMNIVVAS